MDFTLSATKNFNTAASLRYNHERKIINRGKLSNDVIVGPAPGAAEQTLFSATGSGVMLNFWLALGNGWAATQMRVKVYVDGETTASIDCELGSLFGHGFGCMNSNTDPAQADTENFGVGVKGSGGTLTSPTAYLPVSNSGVRFAYPIPYGSGIVITILNPPAPTNATGWTSDTVAVFLQCEYTNSYTSSLRLKSVNIPLVSATAGVFTGLALPVGSQVDLWTLAGPGTLVGFTYMGRVTGSTVNQTHLERNLLLYRDGETTPSWQSSGTEDITYDQYYFRSCIVPGFANVARKSSNHRYVFGASGVVAENAPACFHVDFLNWYRGGTSFNSSLRMALGTETAANVPSIFAGAALYYVNG